jgi:hypothetical protein
MGSGIPDDHLASMGVAQFEPRSNPQVLRFIWEAILQGQKKNDILRNIRLVLFIAAVLISIYFILTGSDPVGIFVGDDLPVPTATYSVDVGGDPIY